MAEPKTKPTDASVEDFIMSVENPRRRADALELLDIFRRATGLEPTMWGPSIVGFGMYRSKSERSSQEGDWPLVGFSPRKQSLTLYVMDGSDHHKELFDNLGKHKTSVACLYINKLDDVDVTVLEQIVVAAFRTAAARYVE